MDLFILITNKIISQSKSPIILELIELINLSKICNVSHTITEYKFNYFRFIYENIFISETIKDHHLDIFQKSQKIYHIFYKLARIYRLNKSKQYNDCDLSMMPLKLNSKNTIGLYQNQFIYLFSKRDLIKLLNASLSHSPYFFSEPLNIKNPYNNIEFTKAHLYNIYGFIKEGDMKISDIIHAFYNSNFDINLILRHHKPIIRNYAIKSYVKNSINNDLREIILDMLDEYGPYMEIDKRFSTNKLISGLKKYLERYLKIRYSMTRYREDEIKARRRDISRFYNLNPTFGVCDIIVNVIPIEGEIGSFLTVDIVPILFLRNSSI